MTESSVAPPPVTTVAHVDWVPTRAAGIARLNSFMPNAGLAYGRDRNLDLGPDDRSNVSCLSPWIRRRMITEEEVITAVLKQHSALTAGKFIQEIFWRTYWKGWLEQRPGVFARFVSDLGVLSATTASDTALHSRIDAASSGNTGIPCFDAWVKELIEIGWLHNHARMWFASIWIFTLKLPWQIGADFMFRHLLDADPASNTLSWRWVAGLQTRGKHYLVQSSNIRDCTRGRFDPVGQLEERAVPLVEHHVPELAQPIVSTQQPSHSRVLVLIHEDDLHPESLHIDAQVVAVAGLRFPLNGSAESALQFSHAALHDGLERAATHFNVSSTECDVTDIAALAGRCEVREVVTAYAPVGRCPSALDQISAALAADGIRLTRIQREFDQRAWPLARAGYFKFRQQIPLLLDALRTP